MMHADPAVPAMIPQDSLNDLIDSWENSPHPSTKVTSYFPAYVQLFNHLRGTACTFIETGILGGGSLFMWRKWLGDKARIIGIDLNPAANRWIDAGFEIYIGDQGDPDFWRATLEQIGKFDALLDDGGHQSFQQIVTVTEALRNCKHSCVIAVEDTGTSFMSDFSNHGRHSFLEYSKDATDCLIGKSFPMYPGRFPKRYNEDSVDFFKNVLSIQFFGGIVAFNVDPKNCVQPQVLYNKHENATSDFRYEGKNEAVVEWPDVLTKEVVIVKGGQN